ncbi:hypothetical protein ABFS82_03G033000 [Erythranthe guttata]
MMHKIIVESVLCRGVGNHSTDMSHISTFLLYKAVLSHKINLGYLICEHLAYVGTVSLLSRKIPYGMILTRVFKKLGIDIPRDLNYVPRNTSISLASLSKMGFQVDETGKWSTGKKKDLKEKKMRR